MDSLSPYFFFHNWQRKLFALFAAIIIWFFVSHSITESKMIRNVPIRIFNLPSDKTIIGLLPNGILNKRINLVLSGSKDVIDEIRPGDLEVNIDASAIDYADWIVQIGKKNLVSLNPNIDIANNITSVSHSEFVIKLNRLVTAKINVQVLPPIGEAPEGYEFLGFWPQRLVQTINGPEEEILRLQSKGLELVFDLNEISKSSLDAIRDGMPGDNNEVAFLVPSKWKFVTISFCNQFVEEINDPDAQYLQIDFLKQELLPVGSLLPLRIFYPTHHLATVNPKTLSLAVNRNVLLEAEVPLFQPALYAKNVSRLLLDVIKDYLAINIVAAPQSEGDVLLWGIEVVSSRELEETYVAYQMAETSQGKHQSSRILRKKELFYRKRFREYLQRLALYVSAEHKLNIESSINGDKIEITEY